MTNKGDLISRSALKEVIKANHYLLSAKNNSTDYGMFTTGIIEAIDNAETVEINTNDIQYAYDQGFKSGYELGKEERPRGKWLFIDEEWFDWKCSICGNESVHSYNYCPNCGAKMNTASTGETPEANK